MDAVHARRLVTLPGQGLEGGEDRAMKGVVFQTSTATVSQGVVRIGGPGNPLIDPVQLQQPVVDQPKLVVSIQPTSWPRQWSGSPRARTAAHHAALELLVEQQATPCRSRSQRRETQANCRY